MRALAGTNSFALLAPKNRNYNQKRQEFFFTKPDPTQLRAPAVKCLVCTEQIDQAQAGYCSGHAQARENLKQTFIAWEQGYGGLTVPDFLERIEKLPGTGGKARELARFLIENPSRWT